MRVVFPENGSELRVVGIDKSRRFEVAVGCLRRPGRRNDSGCETQIRTSFQPSSFDGLNLRDQPRIFGWDRDNQGLVHG